MRTASFESFADARFDPRLARRLRQVLEDGLNAPGTTITGAIFHVERSDRCSWTGTSGLGRLQPELAIRPGDRFRAGSVVKPFASARGLQLVEVGRFTLDSTLPDVLPADGGSLLYRTRSHGSHAARSPKRSAGVDTPEIDAKAARDPRRVWKVSEFLEIAAAKPAMFKPGTRYTYSNTNYTLLGLVIEHTTNRGWRGEVSDRVIKPLGLEATGLPAPGNGSLGGPYAHGYMELNGKLPDTSTVDPSMAGSAGGHALVTTVGDLVRFFDALLAGRLFRRPETLEAAGVPAGFR